MSVPELPGFTYDPVKKRYFKAQPQQRSSQAKLELPAGLNKSVARKEYLKCIDDLIENRVPQNLEWFTFQNKQFQLTTSYFLPSFISQQGTGDIQIGKVERSLILNDSNFRLFELCIDDSDDSFKVKFDSDSSSHESVVFFKTTAEITISINRFNDFNFNTKSIIAGGKLKLPDIIDVSSFQNEQKTYLTFLSSQGLQWIYYDGNQQKSSTEWRIQKKHGDAICCLMIDAKTVLVGFRNGNILRFEVDPKGKSPKVMKFIKLDGLIISINKIEGIRNANILVSVGKHPFQKLVRINLEKIIISEFQSRFSNLSKNKELIKVIKNEDVHCVIYGKRLEPEFDVFLLTSTDLKFPSNLNWDWPVEKDSILDVLITNNDDYILFPLENDVIRKRSIANVKFHPYHNYKLNSIKIFILTRDKNYSLTLSEYIL